MAMPVINTSEIIVGLDVHTALPPYPPAPIPHVVLWAVGKSEEDSGFRYNSMALETSKAQRGANSPSGDKGPVRVGHAFVVGRGHDAGPHDGHVSTMGVNVYGEVVTIGSGSKAEFASGSAKTHAGRLAVHEQRVVNPQLDCGDPAPGPTGFAIANNVSVVAGFTEADRLAGLASMVFDSAFTAAVSYVSGEVAKGALTALGAEGPLAELLAPPVAWAIGAYWIGSPLGWSSSHSLLGGWSGSASDRINDTISSQATGGGALSHQAGSML